MDDFSSELFNSFFDDHLLEQTLSNHTDIQAEHSYSLSEDSAPQSPALSIKMDQDSDDALQLPPTPPSSNHGDSDGSLPPSSPHLPLLPSSPQPQQRPGAISSSPLLTAPHKLQGSGPLMLTEEEKRTLVAEGYPVPNKLPLTKSEEKALKRVRRKIKNKISAQESRRKKKEYVDCLEKKVESYTSENGDLWRKVENLETANRSLLQQLQKLQSLISGKVIPRSCKIASTQTGTCLMMVALCFVLVLGSFSPCLSPLSLLSHSSSDSHPGAPSPSADLYTTSQGTSSSPDLMPSFQFALCLDVSKRLKIEPSRKKTTKKKQRHLLFAVRSRSLLFYDERAPPEESLTPPSPAGEVLRSEAPPHVHTRQHATNNTEAEQRYGPLHVRGSPSHDGGL
uniref:cAMP responsive element binding protein 3-like 1 n=1 Tax=Oryzias latipes TaxID=8090 RepID=A0A3P9HXM3_ORYLA